MATKNYTVSGMTCNHCTASVREEVEEVNGVSTVEVTLETGNVAVTGEGFSDADVTAAIKEAGYSVEP